MAFKEVAIYLDGYTYHASEKHMRFYEDIVIRDAISETPNMVPWSLSWTDVLLFESEDDNNRSDNLFPDELRYRKSIQELMKPSTGDQKGCDTATFYSISNCQEGLSRVTLGHFLIKRVIYEIQEELPNIKSFGTLSPIPGFVDWFNYLDEKKFKTILGKSNSDLSFLKSPDLKVGDVRVLSNKENIEFKMYNKLWK